jgi:hypothetical protein
MIEFGTRRGDGDCGGAGGTGVVGAVVASAVADALADTGGGPGVESGH